jgi:hypothetical protein
LGAVADDLTPFEREKMSFLRMKPHLGQYAGQFVAIHGGRVAAADQFRNGVLRKFFGEYPAGTSVYVGFIGPRPIARVTGPLVVRPSF